MQPRPSARTSHALAPTAGQSRVVLPHLAALSQKKADHSLNLITSSLQVKVNVVGKKKDSHAEACKSLILLPILGVTDGARTHDNRNHNPGLYQLSYGHHCKTFVPDAFVTERDYTNFLAAWQI
jgi:hypothetical protein